MNVTDYTYLMNKPDAITEKQAEALGSVLNEFPYFQSARALRLKGLYDQNSFKYNYALKVTAAHTADRSVLFDFITSESFTSIQSEYYDQKLKDLLEIKVFDSEVVSFEEVNKTPEVRIDPIEQSILKSIKEATTVVFEAPSKEEENTFSELIKTEEESTIEPVNEEPIVILSEEEILDTFKEVTEVEAVTEEVVNEQPIGILNEEEIFNSFQEVTKVEEKEEEPVIEETIITPSEEEILNTFKKVDEVEITEPIIEEEILSTFEEVTTADIKEETEPIINESVVTPSEEEILNTFKEVTEVEEKPADSVISLPIARTTFFDEVVDDEISEVHVNPIEESILVSIKEASTVIFEEEKTIEEPVAAEESLEIETPEVEVLQIKTPDAEVPEVEIPEAEIPENVKEAQENLEIGKPIDFSVSEKHSFQEWLQLARAEPIDRSTEAPKEEVREVEELQKESEEPKELEIVEKKTIEAIEVIDAEEEKKKKAEIIDRFIETNPKISPIKPTMSNPPVQFNINEEENSYLMTETLARVYLEQKKYTKAIQAYEILILKYPEKISFFADRISDIKILQQNNNNN